MGGEGRGGWQPCFFKALLAHDRESRCRPSLHSPIGSPHCYGNKKDWIVSAFYNNGTLKLKWAERLERLIRGADAVGMVLIVQYFYSDQFEKLDPGADTIAVDAATNFILSLTNPPVANVVIEVFNERCTAKEATYIQRVHALAAAAQPARSMLASASCTGGKIPAPELVAAADFVLLHGNGATPGKVTEMVAAVRGMAAWTTAPKPIVFNEDDHGYLNHGVGGRSNLHAAVQSEASWGFLCCCNGTSDGGESHYTRSVGYQCPPVNWGLQGPCLSGPKGDYELNFTKQDWFSATNALTNEAR